MPEMLRDEWIEHKSQLHLGRRKIEPQEYIVAERIIEEKQILDYLEEYALYKLEIKRSLEHRKRAHWLYTRKQFQDLARVWKQETGLHSNMTKRAMHPAYQQIIGMGKTAVPFMLEEFSNGELDDWFWALTAITRENPITSDIAGNVERMAEAWIRWGKAKGYLIDSTKQLSLNFPISEAEATP